jgi:hypothetical protein
VTLASTGPHAVNNCRAKRGAKHRPHAGRRVGGTIRSRLWSRRRLGDPEGVRGDSSRRPPAPRSAIRDRSHNPGGACRDPTMMDLPLVVRGSERVRAAGAFPARRQAARTVPPTRTTRGPRAPSAEAAASKPLSRYCTNAKSALKAESERDRAVRVPVELPQKIIGVAGDANACHREPPMLGQRL